MNNRYGNGTGSFEVKIGADTAKFTNVIITRLKERWYLVRESEMTIEEESKTLSGEKQQCQSTTTMTVNQTGVTFVVPKLLPTKRYTLHVRVLMFKTFGIMHGSCSYI